jgi:peptide chain release factor subunit 1
LFISEPLGLEQAVRRYRPITRAAIISDTPFIAPLIEGGLPGRVCVAVIDERHAHILRGTDAALREVISFGDPVHGRHSEGGWSQARYQRSVAEDVESHLRHVARVLFDLLRTSPYERLLVGCTEPLWPRVLEKLHPEVRRRLIEQRLSVDTSADGPAEVTGAAREVLAGERRDHEDAVLQQLRERASENGGARAATGLDAVLEALVERRVETLLLDEGLVAGGVACPRCGWMGSSGDRCPVDGGALQSQANIVERAVESAVTQSAEVLELHDRPELGPLGGIAATLRF